MSFAVECSQDFNSGSPWNKNFDTYEEAISHAEKWLPKFRAIWISETGEDVMTRKEDWYYFWWSPAVGEAYGIGAPKGRGRGFRSSKQWNELVEYQPIIDLKEFL